MKLTKSKLKALDAYPDVITSDDIETTDSANSSEQFGF